MPPKKGGKSKGGAATTAAAAAAAQDAAAAPQQRQLQTRSQKAGLQVRYQLVLFPIPSNSLDSFL